MKDEFIVMDFDKPDRYDLLNTSLKNIPIVKVPINHNLHNPINELHKNYMNVLAFEIDRQIISTIFIEAKRNNFYITDVWKKLSVNVKLNNFINNFIDNFNIVKVPDMYEESNLKWFEIEDRKWVREYMEKTKSIDDMNLLIKNLKLNKNKYFL